MTDAINELRADIAGMLKRLAELENSNKPKTHKFGHTEARYRPDQSRWIARWNSTPYESKHIGGYETEEDAVSVAKLHSEIAEFVLRSFD